MPDKPWRTEDYWIGQASYAEPVRARMTFPPRLVLHDTTLRDGEGSPGVAFNLEEKLAVARQLDAVGVHRIEVGRTGVSDEQEVGPIRAVAEAGLRSQVWSMSRPGRESLAKSIACGVSGIEIAIPVGEGTVELEGISEQELRRRSVDAVKFVKDHGVQAVFFPMDSTRADLSFFKSLVAEVVEKASPDAVAVVDTRGVASPETIAYLVQQVKEVGDVPVEVHCHNDFGLAVANSLAGVFAGAEVVHTSAAGLGERCGNTPLEALAVALKILYGKDLGLRLDLLYELSRLVAGCARVDVARNQPVVGSDVFVRVHGSFLEQLKKHPTMVFPYRPEMVGRQMDLLLGKVSGAASVALKLEQLGLEATAEQAAAMLAVVKERSVQLKRCITDQEFREIVGEVAGV